MAKPMPPSPPECRAEAIRLARTSGKPHAQIARERGMTGMTGETGETGETLRLWLKPADRDDGNRRDGLTTDEHEEWRRLRREHRMRREQRAIRKQAAAFCAPEAQGDQRAPGSPSAWVEREQAGPAVVPRGRVLGGSPRGSGAWRTRTP